MEACSFLSVSRFFRSQMIQSFGYTFGCWSFAYAYWSVLAVSVSGGENCCDRWRLRSVPSIVPWPSFCAHKVFPDLLLCFVFRQPVLFCAGAFFLFCSAASLFSAVVSLPLASFLSAAAPPPIAVASPLSAVVPLPASLALPLPLAPAPALAFSLLQNEPPTPCCIAGFSGHWRIKEGFYSP